MLGGNMGKWDGQFNMDQGRAPGTKSDTFQISSNLWSMDVYGVDLGQCYCEHFALGHRWKQGMATWSTWDLIGMKLSSWPTLERWCHRWIQVGGWVWISTEYERELAIRDLKVSTCIHTYCSNWCVSLMCFERSGPEPLAMGQVILMPWHQNSWRMFIPQNGRRSIDPSPRHHGSDDRRLPWAKPAPYSLVAGDVVGLQAHWYVVNFMRFLYSLVYLDIFGSIWYVATRKPFIQVICKTRRTPRLLQSLISINFGRGVAQICREISLGTEDDTALGLFWKKAEVSKIPDDKIPDDESWMIFFFGRYMHTHRYIYIYIYIIYNIIYI